MTARRGDRSTEATPGCSNVHFTWGQRGIRAGRKAPEFSQTRSSAVLRVLLLPVTPNVARFPLCEDRSPTRMEDTGGVQSRSWPSIVERTEGLLPRGNEQWLRAETGISIQAWSEVETRWPFSQGLAI